MVGPDIYGYINAHSYEYYASCSSESHAKLLSAVVGLLVHVHFFVCESVIRRGGFYNYKAMHCPGMLLEN